MIYENIHRNELENICDEIFQSKPRKLGMKFYTGIAGKVQFDKAIRHEALKELIKRSNKSLEFKARLYALLKQV